MVPTFLPLLALLWGCEQPPVYRGIASITVHTQTGAGGTERKELTGEQLDKARNCLMQTVEISQEESDSEFLQAVILLQVKDRLGDRMFELYTKKNLKGNKGKYYKSTCIYGIIHS